MSRSIANRSALLGAGLVLAMSGVPVLAQYKVVLPDGSVTYTDRPPVASNVRVTPMGRPGNRAPAAAEIGLPLDVRSAVQRHPVTLYTGVECSPCDTGRRLLQQRGVPYTERLVLSEDDAAALERLVGGRTVPSISIGAQPLRGLSEADWSAYLDAAGYPRENKLPRGWQQGEPMPLVMRSTPVTPAPRPATPPPAPAAAPAEPPPEQGTIRF
ncbi:MAG: glutaredoxin family protein [Rubrivivax sp.]|nr:glutaredoxin family protein [Rubrivivax sp.]